LKVVLKSSAPNHVCHITQIIFF